VIPFLGGCRLAETDRTVVRNYITALQEGGRSANTIRQAKVVLGAMFGMAVADGYLDYNPFHDVKIPKVPGRRAIKIATPAQYLRVRACLPTKPAQVFSTLLVSSGLRFCEAIGLQPADFDFEAGILEVARSVVSSCAGGVVQSEAEPPLDTGRMAAAGPAPPGWHGWPCVTLGYDAVHGVQRESPMLCRDEAASCGDAGLRAHAFVNAPGHDVEPELHSVMMPWQRPVS
jgi:hypothetical protein